MRFRFRTELLPILPIVLVASAAPLLGSSLMGCKKEDKPAVDGGGKNNEGKPPVVIHNKEDIPVMLGGAPMPYEPPPPSSPPPPSPSAPSPSPPPQAAPPAQGAAPAPAAAAQHPSALAIVHNHPPNQPCNPLKREDVEKALSDLQKKSQ